VGPRRRGGATAARAARCVPGGASAPAARLVDRSGLRLRRASIIAQVGARTRTDRELLAAVIDANAAEREFFLRKAIGWALRDYARTAPGWVRQFVETRANTLSNLSRREATKHLRTEGAACVSTE
jgi:3-methyladenine DNA glycosylase AlkD